MGLENIPMIRAGRFRGSIALCVVLMATPALWACPNCVDTIAANSSTGESGTSGSMAGGFGSGAASGYSYSILFMLLVLFAMITALVICIVRQARAHNAYQAAMEFQNR